MITETNCLDIVLLLYGKIATLRRTLNLGDEGQAPSTTESEEEHALAPNELVRSLLSKYALSEIEDAIKWLELGGYVTYVGFGVIAPRLAMKLTPRGIRLAHAKRLDDDERALLYRENPYAVFVARQFRHEDVPLFEYLRDDVLTAHGLTVLDGRVDGVEAFRGEILKKITKARYFLCLLTHREELLAGGFASSVWLYQEIGAAVALRKKPLLLVEDGVSEHFAGELQKNYEYVPFPRIGFQEAFQAAGNRLRSDLIANNFPLPRNSAP